MKTILTVLTCRRTEDLGVDYLANTLTSLEDANPFLIDEKIIACDGDGIDSYPIGWKRIYLHGGERRGNLASFLGILKLAQSKDAGQLIYFEDDVIACRGTVDRMLKIGTPDGIAFVTYFDMKEVWRGAPAGLYEVPATGLDGAGFWGMQAIVFPRRTIDFLLSMQLEKSGLTNHCDILMGEALANDDKKFLVHVPCLVEHVGETSAIWDWAEDWEAYPVNRQAMNFPGRSFDAGKL